MALDQSSILETHAPGSRFNTATIENKENIERYEVENHRLKRINMVLTREINKKQVVASARKHVKSSSASLRRRNNTIKVVRSP